MSTLCIGWMPQHYAYATAVGQATEPNTVSLEVVAVLSLRRRLNFLGSHNYDLFVFVLVNVCSSVIGAFFVNCCLNIFLTFSANYSKRSNNIEDHRRHQCSRNFVVAFAGQRFSEILACYGPLRFISCHYPISTIFA